MEFSRQGLLQGDVERGDLLREGRAVLLSLGEPDLAREFERRARATPSRERLSEILLECLLARHLGR